MYHTIFFIKYYLIWTGWTDYVAHPVLGAVSELAKVNDIFDAEEDGGDEDEGHNPDPEAVHTHQQQWGLRPPLSQPFFFILTNISGPDRRRKKCGKKFILKT